VLTMGQAAANLRVWCGLDWPDIVRLTSGNAAAQMGWTSKGRLAPGADADLVLLDDACAVHATFVAGRAVYRR
jgi:N-acetylglucosamine-6-phosphate deacetylase